MVKSKIKLFLCQSRHHHVLASALGTSKINRRLEVRVTQGRSVDPDAFDSVQPALHLSPDSLLFNIRAVLVDGKDIFFFLLGIGNITVGLSGI